MTIKLQLSDASYQRLIKTGSRIQGTIGLINPEEGNFNEHNKNSSYTPNGKFIRLPHGRASVNEKRIRLSLSIDVNETSIIPADAILDESRQASDFVDRVFDFPMC